MSRPVLLKRATSKAGNALLSDIDKARLAQEWTSMEALIDKCDTLVNKPKSFQLLLTGELELETYLQSQWRRSSLDGSAVGVEPADDRGMLQQSAQHLKDALESAEFDHDQDEARMLSGRLSLLTNDYQAAIAYFELVKIKDEEVEALPLRVACMYGQTLACHALAVEYLEGTHDNEVATGKALELYEKATNVAFSRFIPLRSAPNSTLPRQENLYYRRDCQYAIQRLCISKLYSGNEREALLLLRKILKSTVSDDFRLHTLRLVSRWLTNATPSNVYVPATGPAPDTSRRSSSRANSSAAFTPTAPMEEALLLLLLEEDYLGELAASGKDIPDNTGIQDLYDMFIATLTKAEQQQTLSEALERALKNSFGNGNIWLCYAQLLLSGKHYTRALLPLQRAHKVLPENAEVLTALAEVYAHLGNHAKALGVVEDALHLAPGVGLRMRCLQAKAKALLVHCKQIRGFQTNKRAKQQGLQQQALDTLLRAVNLDPMSTSANYQLALLFAEVRNIPRAQHYCKKVLHLDPEHEEGLYLFSLLLTSQRKFADALLVCEAALDAYPENLAVFRATAQILAQLGGPPAALQAYSCFVQEADMSSVDVAQVQQSLTTIEEADLATVLSGSDSVVSGDGSVSVSVLSGSARAVSGSFLHHGQAKSQTCRLWLDMAGLFLDVDRAEDAESCIREARQADPSSPDVELTLGRLLEHRGNADGAIECYERALSLSSSHVPSLVRLGSVLLDKGLAAAAKKHLSTATTVEATHHEAWAALARALEQDEPLKAADCLLSALSLEETAPVVPFPHTA